MKPIAISDKVVVEMLEQIEQTKGGIIVPQIATAESFDRGKVLSIGTDVMHKDICEGDIVAFHKNGGQVMLTSDRKLLRVLKYDEIYCRVIE